MAVQLNLHDWEVKEWSRKLRALKDQLKELEDYIIEAEMENKPPTLAVQYLLDTNHTDELRELASILDEAYRSQLA